MQQLKTLNNLRVHSAKDFYMNANAKGRADCAIAFTSGNTSLDANLVMPRLAATLEIALSVQDVQSEDAAIVLAEEILVKLTGFSIFASQLPMITGGSFQLTDFDNGRWLYAIKLDLQGLILGLEYDPTPVTPVVWDLKLGVWEIRAVPATKELLWQEA